VGGGTLLLEVQGRREWTLLTFGDEDQTFQGAATLVVLILDNCPALLVGSGKLHGGEAGNKETWAEKYTEPEPETDTDRKESENVPPYHSSAHDLVLSLRTCSVREKPRS